MTGHTKEPWSVPTALMQIVDCEFACEAGPLSNSVAWEWLKNALKDGPKYLMGQTVWHEVQAEVADQLLTKWVGFTVVGCQMSSDTERVTWTYDLSRDPPAPYHYGKTHFSRVSETKLLAGNPCAFAALKGERA